MLESGTLDFSSWRTQAVVPVEKQRVEQEDQEGYQCALVTYLSFLSQATIPPAWTTMAEVDVIQTATQAIRQCVLAISQDARAVHSLICSEPTQNITHVLSILVSWLSPSPPSPTTPLPTPTPTQAAPLLLVVPPTPAERLTKRNDLACLSLVVLGHLVRSPAQCVRLVELGLVTRLVSGFDAALAAYDVGCVAGVMGIVRNLALPLPNRGKIGAAGWVERAVRVLSQTLFPLAFPTPSRTSSSPPFAATTPTHVQPTDMVREDLTAQTGETGPSRSHSNESSGQIELAFRAVMLLKHLVHGAVGNSVRVALGAGMDVLCNACNAVVPPRPLGPVHLEVGRVIGYVVQTLFLLPVPPVGDPAVVPVGTTNAATEAREEQGGQ